MAYLRKNSIPSLPSVAVGPMAVIDLGRSSSSSTVSSGNSRHRLAVSVSASQQNFETKSRSDFGDEDDDNDDDSLVDLGDEDAARIWIRHGSDPGLAVPGSCADVSSVVSNKSVDTKLLPYVRRPSATEV
ncbi:hypothetical protein HK405_008432, partial [Cladochytrium tenue]